MYLQVSDNNQSVSIPIGVMDRVIKEIKKHRRVVLNKRDREKLLMDFEHGLDSYFKFQQFKWEKSPSGKSQHYSDAYLKWIYKKHRKKMTQGELREYKWRFGKQKL